MAARHRSGARWLVAFTDDADGGPSLLLHGFGPMDGCLGVEAPHGPHCGSLFNLGWLVVGVKNDDVGLATIDHGPNPERSLPGYAPCVLAPLLDILHLVQRIDVLAPLAELFQEFVALVLVHADPID